MTLSVIHSICIQIIHVILFRFLNVYEALNIAVDKMRFYSLVNNTWNI
jgi:hypothetical protein